MTIDLNSMSRKELKKLQRDVEKSLKAAEQRERAQAIKAAAGRRTNGISFGMVILLPFLRSLTIDGNETEESLMHGRKLICRPFCVLYRQGTSHLVRQVLRLVRPDDHCWCVSPASPFLGSGDTSDRETTWPS